MSVAFHDVVLPLAHFDLTLSIEMGARTTALYGPSGSGKTSLLELIAGLRTPSAGSIDLGGRVVTDIRRRILVPPRLRRVGYVPQDDVLFPHLSVRQNLRYGARSVDRNVLTILELDPLLDRNVRTLSGGERKRVALGRALLSAPEFLLLDEPLSAVDAPLRGRILEYLFRIRDGFLIPIIYVTHQMEEVEVLCDEIVELHRGHVTGRRPARSSINLSCFNPPS